MLKGIKKAFDDVKKSIEDSQRLRREAEEEQRRQEAEYIASLRQGRIPTVQSSLLLNPSEFCYLEAPVTYRRELKSGTQDTKGILTVTNTRIFFTTPNGSGSWKINIDNVMAVNPLGAQFELKMGGAKGSGFFITPVPHAGLIIESAAKLSKRLMVMYSDEQGPKSRKISQEVRVMVWQRDQGRCVECGASEYLEFDHIIPFSKGGANTEANIQLLCRNCNLRKSNKI